MSEVEAAWLALVEEFASPAELPERERRASVVAQPSRTAEPASTQEQEPGEGSRVCRRAAQEAALSLVLVLEFLPAALAAVEAGASLQQVSVQVRA